MKTNILSYFYQILMNEFNKSEGYNKFLIFALAANLPLPWVFIPYGTQAITVILLIFFIKQYLKVNKLNVTDKNFYIKRLVVLIPSIVGIVLQLFWLPYISQLYSVVLIGIQYIITL